MLLGLFIPAWYLFMALLVSHKPLHFKLFSSGSSCVPTVASSP